MDWKLVILGQLRLRNQRENGGFSELIISHTKLLDQVESLRKEITRLDYHKNELEKQMDEMERDGTLGASVGGQGDGASAKDNIRLRKKVDELNTKLMSKTEELVDRQNKWMEVTESLRKKEDEIKKLEIIIQELTKSQKKFATEMASIVEKLKEKEATYQTLQDEYQALHVASGATDVKLAAVEKENDQLRKQLMLIKSQQADKLNTENETSRKKRDKQLEEEIRKASEEKESSLIASALGHIGAGRRSSKSREGGEKKEKQRLRSGSNQDVAAEVVGPSICPSKPFHTFDAHDSEVSALCFSGDGNYMATGGADKLVKVWSWRPSQEKMELKFTLRGCSQSIMSIQFDQNCHQILAASNDCSARIWTFHEERPKHTLTGHANKVMAAKFMEDNSKVVTGSHDRTLKIWDLQHKACIRTLFAGSSCNDAVAGRGLGNTVISGHFDRRIRFWDTRTATANEIALSGKVTSLDHFPDRHLLLCCSRDDALRLIDLRQNSIVATFNVSGFRVSVDWTRACFSPDGQYVAAGSSDGSIFIWDTNIGGSKPKREKCKEHTKEVVVCSWDPIGQLFATADRNKRVTLWKR